MLAFRIVCLVLTWSALECLEQEVAQSNDIFSRHMYNVLSKEEGNILFSPLSVHTVLSMLAQGANGATADGLARALLIPNADAAASGYSSLLDHLNNVQNVDLSLANKLFVANDACLKDDFQNKLRSHFKSDVESIDVNEGAAVVKQINSWVEEKTNHNIKNLLNDDAVGSNTRMLLVNTINLAAKWKIPFFDSSKNPKSTFYLPNNEKVKVQHMMRNEGFKVKTDARLKFTVVDLPFTNEDASMVLVLPDEASDIKQLESTLSKMTLDSILKGTVETTDNTQLFVPRLNLEKELNLKATLEKLGLGELFSSPDLSRMLCNNTKLSVSQVAQKVVLKMDEVGVEASGATSADLSPRSLVPIIVFNRPFMFLIREGNNLLFQGRIINPTIN